MSNVVSNSEFYMWRTVFAMAHADDVVTDEEVRFMAEILEDVDFSEEQKAILSEDIKVPQDILEMFKQIDDQKDQARFFEFAKELVWIDGDYGGEEQKVMFDLIRRHTKDVDVDALVGHVDLEFEEPASPPPTDDVDDHDQSCSIIQKFYKAFFKN